MMSVADTTHVNFMEEALEEAALAAERGEVPVGCVIVDSFSGDIVARKRQPGGGARGSYRSCGNDRPERDH